MSISTRTRENRSKWHRDFLKERSFSSEFGVECYYFDKKINDTVRTAVKNSFRISSALWPGFGAWVRNVRFPGKKREKSGKIISKPATPEIGVNCRLLAIFCKKNEIDSTISTLRAFHLKIYCLEFHTKSPI